MFKDPIKDKPKSNNGVPYDERSSLFVNVGTHHGVGHTAPVGREGSPKLSAPTLPLRKVKTIKVDERG